MCPTFTHTCMHAYTHLCRAATRCNWACRWCSRSQTWKERGGMKCRTKPRRSSGTHTYTHISRVAGPLCFFCSFIPLCFQCTCVLLRLSTASNLLTWYRAARWCSLPQRLRVRAIVIAYADIESACIIEDFHIGFCSAQSPAT